MMRAPTTPPRFPASRLRMAGMAVFSGALVLAAAGSLSAQNSPGGFSLPDPTATPTPVPQGPADERAGVPIGPRVIPESRPTASQTQAPAASPTPTPTPAATRATEPATTPASDGAPAARTAPSSSGTTSSASPAPSSGTTTQRPSTAAQSGSALGNTPRQPVSPSGGVSGPGFDTPIGIDPDAAPIGPNDWYDVRPDGETGASGEGSGDSSAQTRGPSRTPSEMAATGAGLIRERVFIGLSVMLVLAAALGFLFWRRRRQEAMAAEDVGTSLAFGVHRAIAESESADEGAGDASVVDTAPQPSPPMPKPEPEPQSEQVQAAPKTPAQPQFAAQTPPIAPAPEPKLAPQPEPETILASAAPAAVMDPAKMDLRLEVVGGTRSVMMFSLDFRIEIANRSDKAVRDVNALGALACAQNKAINAAPLLNGSQISSIGRIGPHKSHRISGQLQLPLNQVMAIQQGSKPLFIPLLHIGLTSGDASLNRSYVIGTPSAASASRVHPLPLDGPPGGLPSLRAQLIKQPAVA